MDTGAMGRWLTDAHSIDAALARAGWDAGADALVAGWVEHCQRELEWEETWEPDDRCRYVSTTRPTGERFVVEWVTGDTWELSIAWPDGWGREHVRMGFLEDLQGTAAKIHAAEGPFGGPLAPVCADCSCPQALPACELPNQRGRRLPGDVELRFELLREDLAAYFFIAREGSLNNLWIVQFDPAHLPAALDSLARTRRCAPSLWVQARGERRAWSFTGWRPLLARVRLDGRELLLTCPDASTAVILAHAAGRLQAAVQVGMGDLADFDAGSWLATTPRWRRAPSEPGPVGAAPRIRNSPPPPTDTGTAAPRSPGSDVPPPTESATNLAPRSARVANPVPPAIVAEPATCPSHNSPPLPSHAGSSAQESPKSGTPPLTRSVAEPVPPAGVTEPAVQRPYNSQSPPSPTDPADQASTVSDKPSPTGLATDLGQQSPQVTMSAPPASDAVAAAARAINSPPQRPHEPPPPTSPEPASSAPKQATPRFPLAAGASADELQRHFSEVEAAIPPRLTGTATAVELWQAIREAHQQDSLPITGNWVDLVASLHRRGFLARLPSDRASRAALAMLAELSPVVRRLHHRRWVLGVDL